MKAIVAATLLEIHLLGTVQWDKVGVWSGTSKKWAKNGLYESGPNDTVYKAAGLWQEEKAY